jgi:hypothetical protein
MGLFEIVVLFVGLYLLGVVLSAALWWPRAK